MPNYPADVNDTVVYTGADIYLPKDSSLTVFEDSRMFLFGEFYLNGQPLLTGISSTVGNEVYVGPTQPTDPAILLWWDINAGSYGALKVKVGGSWKLTDNAQTDIDLDEVSVGTATPVGSNWQIWVDTNSWLLKAKDPQGNWASISGTGIYLGPEPPLDTRVLWGDTDEVATAGIPGPVGPQGVPGTTAGSLNVKDFGAKGDGIQDDTSAINAAITAAQSARLDVCLGRSHLVSSTITLTNCRLIGQGGNVSRTTITSSALSGPVIQIKNRSCEIRGVKIDSTSARRAAVTTTGHGIFIAGDDVPAASYPSISRIIFDDLWVANQPTDGIHMIGPGEMSHWDLITITDCVRHGYVLDGGVVAGYTNVQTPVFYVTLERCRALECGGQALIVQTSGGLAPHGFVARQFEALGCCWDTTKRYGGSDYQVLLNGGWGFLLETPDVEDQQYATSITTQGNTKTARATPSKGISRYGGGTEIIHPFFSSLSESFNFVSGAGLLIRDPKIFTGAYSTLQNPAIIIGSGVKDVEVHWQAVDTTGATQVLRNQAIDARIVADGIPQIGDAFTVGDIADGIAPVSVQIVSAGLTSSTRRTIVASRNPGVADTLQTLHLYTGNSVKGADMFIFRGNEDITVKHGTGNIRTKTAADVIMTATANTVMHMVYDGSNWIQV